MGRMTDLAIDRRNQDTDYLRLVRLGGMFERAALAQDYKAMSHAEWHVTDIARNHDRNWAWANAWTTRGRNIVRKARGLPLLNA
jgi:hypothetical protein